MRKPQRCSAVTVLNDGSEFPCKQFAAISGDSTECYYHKKMGLGLLEDAPVRGRSNSVAYVYSNNDLRVIQADWTKEAFNTTDGSTNGSTEGR